MITYKKYPPPHHLKPFVECFYVWEVNGLTHPLIVESPPTGYASMVFNYGNLYEVASADRNYSFIHSTFITGQASKSYHFKVNKPIGVIGVVFLPAAISTLFGLPMFEFTDERHDLSAVLGKETITLKSKIEDSFDTQERINHLVAFLTETLQKNKYRLDKADYASSLIINRNGVININDLLLELYISRRQFEKSFLYKVGVSPKYFARVRRISYLCNQLVQKNWDAKHLQNLVYDLGYYDQAHFIKDFSSFTGKSPLVYLKNNVELGKWLKNDAFLQS